MSLHEIETRLSALQREVRNIWDLLQTVSPLTRHFRFRRESVRAFVETLERPTEPELAGRSGGQILADAGHFRVATIERKSGPPAIAKLAAFGQRFLNVIDDVSLMLSDDFDADDFAATIEAAKREDAELQQLRRIAEAVGEYAVADRMRADAAHRGDLLAGNNASLAELDAKRRLFDLMGAWRNPARPR